MSATPSIPVCLTIAGSDSGGGAGIQADLRTFRAFDTYGASAITAITAQNPAEVLAIHPIPIANIRAQLTAITKAYNIGAIKTGMLLSPEIIKTVAAHLETINVPLVVDPVMIATSGKRLLEENAVSAMCENLLPQADIITPNLPEAEVLAGHPIQSIDNMITAALALSDRFGAVYLKGGHAVDEQGTDYLAFSNEVYRLHAPTLSPRETHGTGCTLSAALAACLAKGQTIKNAAINAKAFVWNSLNNARQLGPNSWGLYPPTPPNPNPVVTTQVR